MKDIESKELLKQQLRPRPSPETYYGIEDTRMGATNPCRLRCNNPNLNQNLFLRGMSDTHECSCGHPSETTGHFLLTCPKYARAWSDAQDLLPVGAWNERDLLVGSSIRYSTEENLRLCKITQQYIQATGRFN